MVLHATIQEHLGAVSTPICQMVRQESCLHAMNMQPYLENQMHIIGSIHSPQPRLRLLAREEPAALLQS